MMKFTEDSRVKIPTILHLTRLGYNYLSLNGAKCDENTNIFPEIFKESIVKINDGIQKAEAMLKILANQKRLIILCHLSDGRKSAGELTKAVDLSHSALSQHLSKMKNLNLVEDSKEGQEVFYSIKSYEVRAILSTLYLIYCR